MGGAVVGDPPPLGDPELLQAPKVRGSMYKKKVAPDLGPNPHTAPRIRKEVLTPPPPTPPHTPKKGYLGTGG